MSQEAQAFLVGPAHAGARLDRFLQDVVPRMSRSAVHRALDEGRIQLASGLAPKPARRLRRGERVVVTPRGATGTLALPPPVLARGDGWMVVDKPAGMRSVPSARHPGSDAATATGLCPAHRLDRWTSGCLLLTSSAVAARHFEEAFREWSVQKAYAAVVVGEPAAARWSCRQPIGVATSSRVPGKVEAREGGRPAVTDFELAATRGGWALVRARPRTGRRHQVRVHAAASGHPIVGDLLHGSDERLFVRHQLGRAVPEIPGVLPGRHLLHARSLAFRSPEGRDVLVRAPWPPDFPLDLTDAWGTLSSWPT